MWRLCLLVFINLHRWRVLQPHASDVLHCLLHTRKHHLEADRGQVRVPPSVLSVLHSGCGYFHSVCTIRVCAVFFVFFNQIVSLIYREAIKGGLMALKNVIPGGDTLMNLGLQMVREFY